MGEENFFRLEEQLRHKIDSRNVAYETAFHVQDHHAVMCFVTNKEVVDEEDECAKQDNRDKPERHYERTIARALVKHKVSGINSQPAQYRQEYTKETKHRVRA